MVVEVKLFARFREGRFKTQEMEAAADSSVGDVLAALKIPAGAIGILLVNGRSESVDCRLGANDVVSLFPAIGGG